MKTTFFAKPGEVEKKWVIIDATDKVLGRIASQAASIIRGKTKPTFTPHTDTGDNVIIINAAKVKLTGKKWDDKTIFFGHANPMRIAQKGSGPRSISDSSRAKATARSRRWHS